MVLPRAALFKGVGMEALALCEIVVAEEALDALWGVLALKVHFGWEEESLPTGETRVRVYNLNRPFIDGLAAAVRAAAPMAGVEVREVSLPDWQEAWKQFFTPVVCGTRFLVLPPWLADTTPLEGRWPIHIEPKSAFGTGHHATTALCLRVLSDLIDAGCVRAGMRFLDLGTGSGILGLGCCRAGLTGIGMDIDPLAVDNARENCALNAVRGFDVRLGSVEAAGEEGFDLILANILAAPLCDLAPELVKRRRGVLVLSGILDVQADKVVAAYRAQGLPEPRRQRDGEWVALVWE